MKEKTIRYERRMMPYESELTLRIYPEHGMVHNWGFNVGEEAEAKLCHAMAEVAQNNGISVNDLQHLFPAVLRMLKSDIDWSK